MDIIIAFFLLTGVFFALVASLGILRLPDLYMRMHAATKAGTVGVGFVLLSGALFFQDIAVTSRTLGTLFFIILTAPVAAHLLGKAMLQKGYRMWRQTDSEKSE